MHRMSAIEILVASPQNVNLNIYFPFFFDILFKGPSINDVAFKGEGGIWGDFQGLTEATGGGREGLKREN